jgi:RiboL-PSP-HEPN
MTRYTQSYSNFVVRLEEIEHLRRIASDKEKIDPIALRNEINALCRGAIVLLCSHLEAYIKEIGEAALESLSTNKVSRSKIAIQTFYYLSQSHIKEIQGSVDPQIISEKVMGFVDSEAAHWSRIGTVDNQLPILDFNKGFSNPGFKKIIKYFNRFGYSKYKADIAVILKADFGGVANAVDGLVDLRNKIAHGDPTATRTPQEIKLMIGTIKKFSRTTDQVFSKWWRKNYCVI